ncbi:hypothetical protein Spb1_27790 [Planctopirus ephydatiae]|uniref:Uncharacterized protein n=1 Tax=Planctopirus ephydatiae TaxID=2528019 RepID=A0A518GQK8_9PLAN|nr:hypothetical protein [Planctopirus ephydatiae]QDV30844.1 hypothetical protein Spb1_27790 [Planctopirus ephydatiae]
MPSERSKQIDMAGIRLKADLSIGCCQLSHASSLPLSETFVCLSPSEVSITFWGDTKEPWDGVTLVNVYMFKHPHGRKEFERLQEFFSGTRKKRARLPEGIPFTEETLAIKNVPESWEHSAFARSARDFIHTYNSKRFGVLVRFMGKEGTILDNPLIKRIHRNLRLIEDQWIVKYPETETRRKRSSQLDGVELPFDVQSDIQTAISIAQSTLKLKPKAKPEQTAKAIHDFIEQTRADRTRSMDRDQLSIELGALWGAALCNAARWRWLSVGRKGKAGVTAVVNENGSFAVNPFALIYGIMSTKKNVNNALLLFNMICSGRMPESADNSYTWLS